ncbi:hypothetical protein [Fimbriiglobus ruber]|uniref:hypothetical protein n=1 Tax=Fimbriiglobus ruber TaxID=1908690 RepID=UPI00117A8673|nr:hypothetical protein [Fimbriiglobus ruber]
MSVGFIQPPFGERFSEQYAGVRWRVPHQVVDDEREENLRVKLGERLVTFLDGIVAYLPVHPCVDLIDSTLGLANRRREGAQRHFLVFMLVAFRRIRRDREAAEENMQDAKYRTRTSFVRLRRDKEHRTRAAIGALSLVCNITSIDSTDRPGRRDFRARRLHESESAARKEMATEPVNPSP